MKRSEGSGYRRGEPCPVDIGCRVHHGRCDGAAGFRPVPGPAEAAAARLCGSLPADWGLHLRSATRDSPLKPLQLLKFLGLLVLSLVIFTFNAIYPLPSVGLFVLPVFPLVRLAYPAYRSRPLQAGVELLLGVATVWIAFAIPTPEGAWSSPWIHAGGAATVGLMISFWAWRLPERAGQTQFNNRAAV